MDHLCEHAKGFCAIVASISDSSGCNSVDGLKEASVYAVGFNGEIWHRQQGIWQSIDSPINLALHQVKVVREDLVFACGQLGTLLRSNGEHWEVIKHDVSTDDFWELEWFGERLYVATESGLFWLESTDDLQPVDMGITSAPTCQHLHAVDGVLLSSGPRNCAGATMENSGMR
ncbi:beta propeller repeat protein [Flavobacterium collinsii]|uniref:hypothetical protein n=1 Tax=Flavobacterium collinsii TaxID=1114861 RepID=UPI0021E03E3A|nr:hypothetical protein [Flavobacterium collinsii]